MVRHSDRIIGMERQHVRDPPSSILPRSAARFTLKELVATRRCGVARSEPITDWLARVHAGRLGADLMVSRPTTTSPPHDQPDRRSFDMADEVSELAARLFPLLLASR